jgi:hypothetical protein
MLTEQLVKRRQYLGKWESLVDITDTDTGRIYHEMFTTADYPTVEILTPLVVKAKQRIQAQLDIEENDLNLTIDEDRLLGYYRSIKRDVILRIRQNSGATLQQARDYIAARYPESPFDFSRLYEIWLEISNCANWEEFKLFCINKKFEGID